MASKQTVGTDPSNQYGRRGGLASPIKQSGNHPKHIKVGNSVHAEIPPKGPVKVKNQPQGC